MNFAESAKHMLDRGILFAYPRSGSSFLQRALCEGGSPGIYEPIRHKIKFGKMKEPLDIYLPSDDPKAHPVIKDSKGKFVVIKEVLGKSIRDFGRYFPFKKGDKAPKPVILLKHPISNFASIKRQEPSKTLEEFLDGYKHLVDFAKSLDLNGIENLKITFEDLVKDPKGVLKRICDFWDMPYSNKMLTWSKSLQETMHFEPEQWNEITSNNMHRSLEGSKGLDMSKASPPSKYEKELDPQDVQAIHQHLTPLYEQFRKDSNK